MTENKPKRPRDPAQLAKLMIDIAALVEAQEAMKDRTRGYYKKQTAI